MVSNKNRLYIALYPSGVPDNELRRYHWGFLIGPKIEDRPQVPGWRHHVRNHPIQEWFYEELPLANVQSTTSLLARILIAKIEDEERLVEIFRTTPVVQGHPDFSCRSWVADALWRIAEDGAAVGTSCLDWRAIEPLARWYVAAKIAAGRYAGGVDMALPRPTWDMLEERETIQ